jgi:hypothetical protein
MRTASARGSESTICGRRAQLKVVFHAGDGGVVDCCACRS